MCIDCSGIHRNLGTHISFVRSVNLDSWTVPQVEFMEEWGNARAKAFYEAQVPAHYQRPHEGAGVREIQRWIRDKCVAADEARTRSSPAFDFRTVAIKSRAARFTPVACRYEFKRFLPSSGAVPLPSVKRNAQPAAAPTAAAPAAARPVKVRALSLSPSLSQR